MNVFIYNKKKMTALELTFEEKKELEENILLFKKEKLEEFIQTSILLGELAKNMKNNKNILQEKIDKISPIWIRLMSEEVDNLLFSMQEIVYQINKCENMVQIENYKNVENENENENENKNKINIDIDKYRKIIQKKNKSKQILKPILPLLKNNSEYILPLTESEKTIITELPNKTKNDKKRVF
jgi:hypothetical protein